MVGGFGDAEVFSLSSTQMLVAGEGGLIATDDDLLAQRCRQMRDDQEPARAERPLCMNARMSELHAAVALASFDSLDVRLDVRRNLARRYREALQDVPGVSFPRVTEGDLSTHRAFVVLLDPAFGRAPADVVSMLRARGIDAQLTYPMPLHRVRGRAHAGAEQLPGTGSVASRALSLPIWDRMGSAELDAVVRALRVCSTEHTLI
jgi:dTDP-4-amino-4,6-dideoxygalactose transaminase